jgi:glycosyltransferase involved in cell wall biosynthesis
MSEPLVSVIIPVFNREYSIQRALASVVTQSEHNTEIIVVDDGSTDRTSDVVSATADSRVILVRARENRGAAAARNLGVEAASGEYLAFLDSDDAWSPDKLAVQLAYHREQKLGPRASCTGYLLDHAVSGSRQRRVPDVAVVNRHRMVDGCEVCPGSTLLVPRSTFLQVGPFDERLRRLEDWEWMIRYLGSLPLAIVPEVLAEIAPSGYGDARLVSEAATRMRSQLVPVIRAQFGGGVARRFKSSVAIYTAAALFQDHRYIASAGRLLAAALWSPPRVLNWGRGVARSFSGSRFLESTSVVSPRGR